MQTLSPTLVPTLALVISAAGLASAQEASEPVAPLAGPQVQSPEVPGVRAEYVPGISLGLDGMGRSVPLREYLDAVRSLAGEEVSPDVRLTPDQVTQIREETARFAGETREYLRAVRPELDADLEQLPASDRARAARETAALERLARTLDAAVDVQTERRLGARGRRPGPRTEAEARGDAFRLDMRDRPAPPERPEQPQSMEPYGEAPKEQAAPAAPRGIDPAVRARLVELRAGAPQIGDLQVRVWQLLGEPQRAALAERLQAVREDLRDRAGEERIRRALAQREQEAGGPGAATDRAPPALDDAAIDRIVSAFRAGELPEPFWSRLPARARTRLESLTPERRAQAVERLFRTRETH